MAKKRCNLLHRITTLILTTLPCILSIVPANNAISAEKQSVPNVVLILSDDQGWGDVSLNGNSNLRTPNMDALAREGARFERFFVQPVCSPTRAEFLTGRWHPRGGVTGTSIGEERLDLDETTIAQAFKKAGYATGCFGKWHSGTQYPYHPNGRGFDEYYGFTSGHWGEYFNPPLDHNGQDVKGEGYITDDLTTKALDYLGKNSAAGTPSFIYLAYNTPHSPMQVPDKYWQRFEKKDLKLRGTKENLDHTRAALAMCENIDDNLGRIREYLKKHKLEEDTIVVYFSDNGPNGPRWNDGMKGRKGSTDEGGVRSPLHVRWPGHIKPGTVVKPIAAAVDLYPTLVDLAGIKRVGARPLDGISLAPWLLGKNAPTPDRVLFHHWRGRVSARNQRYRLDHTGKLYDLVDDPGQQKNIVAEQPDVARKLSMAVAAYKRDVLGELKESQNRPLPVGYAEFPRTLLPARDGVAHADVKRSARAPNCSFFTNWTKPADSMTWEVDIHQPGEYEAILHYTCPKEDVGSAVELSLGAAKWQGTIKEGHNPPLRGKEHDRVDRGSESYVKDFRPLSLGVEKLPAGKGTLTLKALKVPGKSVGDIRLVELVLKK